MTTRGGHVEKPKRQRPRVAKEDRLRAARACISCQRSKSRCIEGNDHTGQCSRCCRKALTCSYARPASLELTTTSPSPRSGQQSQRTAINEDHLEDWVSGPREDRNVVREFETLDNPRENVASVDGFFPTIEPLQDRSLGSISNGRILSRIREAMFLNPSSANTQHDASWEHSRTEKVAHVDVNQALVDDALAQLPPKPVADFLFASCFELGTDSFFYFNQPELKHQLDDLYANPESPLRRNCNFTCITLMALALGSQFAHLKTTNSKSRIHETGHYPGLMFYNVARSLIPDVIANHSVEAAQACFVMAVYLLPAHAYDKSYFYTGLALRIAIALDLHRDKSHFGLSPEVIEARHRLWWSIYSLERTVSIKLGRPRSIDANDISTPLPAPLPSLDSNQVLDNVHHQIANAKLVKIMDRLAQRVPLTFNPRDSAMIKSLEDMQQELSQWKLSLPPFLQLHGLVPRAKGYRTVIHLHQNYANAWIILCRLPLLFLVRERLKKAFVNPEMELLKDTTVESLAGSCIEAARKMIELFETLRQTQSLAKFSFTDFQGCSTATIIMLLHTIIDTNAPHTQRIASGFKCLQFMASGNEEAKVGVRFVEEFQLLADEASARIRMNSAREESLAQSSSEMLAYEDWLHKVVTSNAPLHEDSLSNGAATQRFSSAASTSASASASFSVSEPCHPHQHRSVEPVIPVVAPSILNRRNHRSPGHCRPERLQGPEEEGTGNSDDGGNKDDNEDGARNTDFAAAIIADDSATLESDIQYPNALPDLLPSNMSHFDESFILGLTGLDTLDFTDQTYWPY